MGGRGGLSHMSGGINALGPRGPLLSAMQALPLANPNYSLAQEFRINCQRCVWAFEMLRRGFSVEAARSDSSDYVGSIKGIHDFWSSARNADQKYWLRVDRMARTVADQFAIVERKMKEWGEGSRAILANTWIRGGGHIWNIEYSGGKIHYYDAQIGREVDITSRNNRTQTLDIFARVDNLDVPDSIMKAVVLKNKRSNNR